MAVFEPSSNEPASDARLAQRLRAAISASSSEERLLKRACRLQVRCLIGVGNESLLLAIDQGELALQDRLPPLTAWDFAIRGSARAWTQFWRQPPPPGWHDLLALSKRGELRIEGNLQPLMANLQYFKDLLALPRAGGEP